MTQFPLPVLTGIGHEKDQSVTDMVAWKALKTPTAVAGFLIDRTLECENRIISMAGEMASAVTGALEAADEQLSSFQNRTAATARLVVRVNNERLGYHTETLRRSARNALQKAGDKTGRLEQSLRHLDPASVLKGFT